MTMCNTRCARFRRFVTDHSNPATKVAHKREAMKKTPGEGDTDKPPSRGKMKNETCKRLAAMLVFNFGLFPAVRNHTEEALRKKLYLVGKTASTHLMFWSLHPIQDCSWMFKEVNNIDTLRQDFDFEVYPDGVVMRNYSFPNIRHDSSTNHAVSTSVSSGQMTMNAATVNNNDKQSISAPECLAMAILRPGIVHGKTDKLPEDFWWTSDDEEDECCDTEDNVAEKPKLPRNRVKLNVAKLALIHAITTSSTESATSSASGVNGGTGKKGKSQKATNKNAPGSADRWSNSRRKKKGPVKGRGADPLATISPVFVMFGIPKNPPSKYLYVNVIDLSSTACHSTSESDSESGEESETPDVEPDNSMISMCLPVIPYETGSNALTDLHASTSSFKDVDLSMFKPICVAKIPISELRTGAKTVVQTASSDKHRRDKNALLCFVKPTHPVKKKRKGDNAAATCDKSQEQIVIEDDDDDNDEDAVNPSEFRHPEKKKHREASIIKSTTPSSPSEKNNLVAMFNAIQEKNQNMTTTSGDEDERGGNGKPKRCVVVNVARRTEVRRLNVQRCRTSETGDATKDEGPSTVMRVILYTGVCLSQQTIPVSSYLDYDKKSVNEEEEGHTNVKHSKGREEYEFVLLNFSAVKIMSSLSGINDKYAYLHVFDNLVMLELKFVHDKKRPYRMMTYFRKGLMSDAEKSRLNLNNDAVSAMIRRGDTLVESSSPELQELHQIGRGMYLNPPLQKKESPHAAPVASSATPLATLLCAEDGEESQDSWEDCEGGGLRGDKMATDDQHTSKRKRSDTDSGLVDKRGENPVLKKNKRQNPRGQGAKRRLRKKKGEPDLMQQLTPEDLKMFMDGEDFIADAATDLDFSTFLDDEEAFL